MSRPFVFLLAALTPLLLYARTTTFGYVHADDVDLIARNQTFLSSPANLPSAFTRSYFEVDGDPVAQRTYYRPLAIVSFMADAARAGAHPGAYHATNVVLHAAATCLLLALALAWGARKPAALAAALVFAVHPLNVQAVAWIAGRNDLLLAVFTLLSLLAWTRIARPGAERPNARGQPLSATGSARFAAAHTACFAGALFSKETGLVVPLLALLRHRAVVRQPLTRAHTAALCGNAAVTVVWAVLRWRVLGGAPGEFGADTARTLASNAPQFLSITRKLLFPVELNVAPGVHDLDLALAAVALAVFGFLARRLPSGVAALAVAWVLAFLVPTLLVRGLPAYEHRAYLPMIGVLLAAAALRGPSLPLLLVVPVLAILAWERQDAFRDPFTYWNDAARDARFGPLAHVNLGQLHEAEGRLAEARREYLRALERDPATPRARNNLGVVLMRLDDPDGAVRQFRQETERHPWNADAWYNLGLWAQMQGRDREARRYFERAIVENRAYRPAYEKLGLPPPQ